MFIAITLNHLRAVKAWADAHKGQATLDVSSFVLDVKARNRYYRLFPQFIVEERGTMAHTSALTPEVTGFIGWRPYAPLRLRLSSDKLLFKQAVAEAGLATPAHWLAPEQADADFILKRSMGSFGYQLAGPFRQGQALPETLPAAMTGPEARGVMFAEAFVPGHNLKVWFWDGQPVHTQCQAYPLIQGDGKHTVEALVVQRLEEVGQRWNAYKERDAILSSLAFQGVALDTCLPAGQTVWLDYRYGRRFQAAATTEAEDNAWRRLPPLIQDQITQAGQWVAQAVKTDVKAPVLCAIDGVVDPQGKVWWLELNSNPICPPTAYFAMLGSLFGTSTQAPANAFAAVVRAQQAGALRRAETGPLAGQEGEAAA